MIFKRDQKRSKSRVVSVHLGLILGLSLIAKDSQDVFWQ